MPNGYVDVELTNPFTPEDVKIVDEQSKAPLIGLSVSIRPVKDEAIYIEWILRGHQKYRKTESKTIPWQAAFDNYTIAQMYGFIVPKVQNFVDEKYRQKLANPSF